MHLHCRLYCNFLYRLLRAYRNHRLQQVHQRNRAITTIPATASIMDNYLCRDRHAIPPSINTKRHTRAHAIMRGEVPARSLPTSLPPRVSVDRQLLGTLSRHFEYASPTSSPAESFINGTVEGELSSDEEPLTRGRPCRQLPTESIMIRQTSFGVGQVRIEERAVPESCKVGDDVRSKRRSSRMGWVGAAVYKRLRRMSLWPRKDSGAQSDEVMMLGGSEVRSSDGLSPGLSNAVSERVAWSPHYSPIENRSSSPLYARDDGGPIEPFHIAVFGELSQEDRTHIIRTPMELRPRLGSDRLPLTREQYGYELEIQLNQRHQEGAFDPVMIDKKFCEADSKLTTQSEQWEASQQLREGAGGERGPRKWSFSRILPRRKREQMLHRVHTVSEPASRDAWVEVAGHAGNAMRQRGLSFGF